MQECHQLNLALYTISNKQKSEGGGWKDVDVMLMFLLPNLVLNVLSELSSAA